jgi:hypothetical protein
VARSVPAGNSSTEDAKRQADSLRRGISQRIFITFLLLFRKTTSMANFMPKVWMASQGTIHNPSPGGRLLCFNSPIRRFLLVSAASAVSASTVPLVMFLILSFKNEFIAQVRRRLLWQRSGGRIRRSPTKGVGALRYICLVAAKPRATVVAPEGVLPRNQAVPQAVQWTHVLFHGEVG